MIEPRHNMSFSSGIGAVICRRLEGTRVGPRIKFVRRSWGTSGVSSGGFRGFSKSENTLNRYLSISIRPNLITLTLLESPS